MIHVICYTHTGLLKPHPCIAFCVVIMSEYDTKSSLCRAVCANQAPVTSSTDRELSVSRLLLFFHKSRDCHFTYPIYNAKGIAHINRLVQKAANSKRHPDWPVCNVQLPSKVCLQ